MLISLAQWLQGLYPDALGFLRVFQYITFRAVMAALTALLLGLAFGPWVIRRLTELKIGQPVREYGVQAHLAKKGTPTMGGVLLVLNPKNSEAVTATAEAIYLELRQAGMEVLLDDRDARPGVKFAEADLLGVPHRLVLGERSLKDAAIEYRHRRSGAEEKVALGDVLEFLQQRLAGAAPG